jgi:predicted nucleic acid-binding protein
MDRVPRNAPIRVVLDACVLYPTVMREVLIGVARQGVFAPLWSERITGEWVRAAAKLGAKAQAQAEGEAALLQAAFPQARVAVDAPLVEQLYLPDPNDTHVLAAAMMAQAPLIITQNLRDFPPALLADHGISRASPDDFLLGLLRAAPEAVQSAVHQVHGQTTHIDGQEMPLKRLLKKARLPRLAKALD